MHSKYLVAHRILHRLRNVRAVATLQTEAERVDGAAGRLHAVTGKLAGRAHRRHRERMARGDRKVSRAGTVMTRGDREVDDAGTPPAWRADGTR